MSDSEFVQQQLASMEADRQIGKVELPRITAQQRTFVACRIGGMSISAAAKEVGATPSTGSAWEKRPDVQAHMDHYLAEYSEKVLPRVTFGKEDAHAMYLQAYHMAGTSAEMTRATDSLVKLHGLLDKQDVDDRKPQNAKQLEGLDTADLLRYAALGMESLAPEIAVDGEFTEVPDGEDDEG
ncbi:hypothetical protein [Celeribacter sp.]|uniref:hypothetical protein n=1 Tax=Celeribacter sp. TaxID=1890673 RepID=UPI003A93BB1C